MSNSRRQRFTVEIVAPGNVTSKQVILAYSAQSVIDHYNRRGIAVVGIEKGDFRKVRAAAKPSGRYAKNERAIREAIAFFDLKLPVEIKLTGHQGGRMGAHTLSLKGGQVVHRGTRVYGAQTATSLFHKISVKNWLTPEEAGRTLWHELTHAMQAERAFAGLPSDASPYERAKAWQGCAERSRRIPYSRRPIEVEAREHESMNDSLPLMSAV